MSDTRLSGWEETERLLGPYERPDVIDWETTPALARGTAPAHWDHGHWGDAS